MDEDDNDDIVAAIKKKFADLFPSASHPTAAAPAQNSVPASVPIAVAVAVPQSPPVQAVAIAAKVCPSLLSFNRN